MRLIGLIIIFICFAIGLFYCLPVTIRDWMTTIKELKEMPDDSEEDENECTML